MGKKLSPAGRWKYEFKQTYMKLARQYGQAPTSLQLEHLGFHPNRIIRNFGVKFSDIYELLKKEYPSRLCDIPFRKEKDKSPKKDELAKLYAQKYKELGRSPTYIDCNIRDTMIARLFGGMFGWQDYAREHFPGYFPDLEMDKFVTGERIRALEDDIKNKRVFFVTTAIDAMPLFKPFINNAKKYCQDRDGAFLVLTCQDPAHSRFSKTKKIDKALVNMLTSEEEEECAGGHIITQDTALNKNLFLSRLKISAKQKHPLMGVRSIVQKKGSAIFASPKQELEVIKTSNATVPRVAMTTGSCSLPDYNTDLYWSERLAYMAEHEHVIGGIIVEIEDDKTYHFRQVQADRKGRFYDLGVLYGE